MHRFDTPSSIENSVREDRIFNVILISISHSQHKSIQKQIIKAEGEAKPKQKANSEAPWRKKKDRPSRRGVSVGMAGRL